MKPIDHEEFITKAIALQSEIDREDSAAARSLSVLLTQSVTSWSRRVQLDDHLCTPAMALRVVDLSRANMNKLPARARELAELAVEISQHLDENDYRALQAREQAYRCLSSALACCGDFESALRILDAAELCIQESWVDEDLCRGRINHARSIIHRQLGQPAEARRCISLAKASFTEYGDMRLLAESLYVEGMLTYNEGQHVNARQLFERVAEVMRFSKDEHMEGGAWLGIGHCYNNEGDESRALQAWAKARAIFKRIGAECELIRANAAIGRVMVRRGDVEDGLASLWEAVRACDELEMRGDVVDLGLEIVEIMVAGDGDSAEIAALCQRLATSAHAAGMAAQAATAIGMLRRAVADGRADAALAADVRRFVSDVKVYPDMQFRPSGGIMG